MESESPAPEGNHHYRSHPWDFFLAFWEADLEADYWQSQDRSLRVWDRIGLIMGFVIQLLGVLKGPLPMWTLVFTWVGMVLIAPSIFVWSFSTNGRYMEWRAWVMAGLRIGFLPLSSYTRALSLPPQPGTPAVLAKIVFNSNVMAIFSMSFGYQVRFRMHLWVQLICTLIAMWFAPLYCDMWFSREEFNPIFTDIRHVLEHMFHALMTLQLEAMDKGEDQVNGKCGCVLIVHFMQWTVGFLGSCVVHCCIEARSRFLFMVSQGDLNDKDKRWLLKACWDTIVVWCWALALGAICGYAGMRSML